MKYAVNLVVVLLTEETYNKRKVLELVECTRD